MKVKRLDDDVALSIRNKLREIRKRTGLSMAKYASEIGYTSGNIGDWESGKALPSLSALLSISKKFEVSLDWLLVNKIFLPQEHKQELICEDPITYQVQSRDPDIQKLIEAFSLLDDDKRNALKTYTAFLLSQKVPDILELSLNELRAPALDPNPISEEKRVYLPILGTAAAGTPILTEELLEGFLSVPTAKINKNSFLIRVKGESMIEANINNGDLVIINPQPTVENGEIALVKVDGEVTIKKFYRSNHEVRLRPANSCMRDIIVKDLSKLIILGRVIGVVSAEEADKNMIHEFNGPNE